MMMHKFYPYSSGKMIGQFFLILLAGMGTILAACCGRAAQERDCGLPYYHYVYVFLFKRKVFWWFGPLERQVQVTGGCRGKILPSNDFHVSFVKNKMMNRISVPDLSFARMEGCKR